MSNTHTHQLRMLGFSANEAGIICHHGGARFAHERVGISRVEVSRDSKDARALVDAVIAAIDEPRALTGRDRRGGAVLIFKAGMGVNNSRREFALRGGEEIVITFGSEGYTLDPNLFQWPKGRGVLDVRAMRFRRCSRSLQKSRTMQHGLPARDVRRNSNRSVRTPPGWTNSGPTSRPVK